MKTITEQQILDLKIAPKQCVEWAEESFKSKQYSDVPPKISVHPFSDCFYTSMICYHRDLERVCVKVISRIPGNNPTLNSKILLFNAKNSELLALMDSNTITTMRTGAVAALAAKLFTIQSEDVSFGIVGLGNVGLQTLKCLLSIYDKTPQIWLMEYKDHVEKVKNEFPSVQFYSTSNKYKLIRNTNTLFSCVTIMHEQFLSPSVYPPGYTLIPVHVRGFQECDIVFDKIFGDDTGNLQNFKYFNNFKYFAEISDVLLRKRDGRVCNSERIISYNYGIALHDLWFSSKIYDMIVLNDKGKINE